MDRLTKWMGEHAAVVNNHANYIDRLAYYEDLEEQGRLIVLPCKVGGTAYTVIEDCETPPFIDTGKVFAISVDPNKTIWLSARFESGLRYYYTQQDVGKTVFLTREEAEAALKGEAHGMDKRK